MPSTVINHTTLGRKWNLPLLLVLRLLHKTPIPKNLQVDQPPADRHTPKQKHCPKQVEPRVLAEAGISRHEAAAAFWVVRQTWRPHLRADRQISSCRDSHPRLSAEQSSARSPVPGATVRSTYKGERRSPSPAHWNPPPRYPYGSLVPAPAEPIPCDAPSRQSVPDRAGWHLPGAGRGSSRSNC